MSVTASFLDNSSGPSTPAIKAMVPVVQNVEEKEETLFFVVSSDTNLSRCFDRTYKAMKLKASTVSNRLS